jgi:hypothetical protein
MSRPYTGTSDGISKRKRPGTERFMQIVVFLGASEFTNLGTHVIRKMRGKPQLSVHASGRAMDVGFKSRAAATNMIDTIVRNADLFELELLIDYFPGPHGRGWKCTRNRWLRYLKRTVSGAPGGKWFHIELSPRMADNPAAVEAAWKSIFAGK